MRDRAAGGSYQGRGAVVAIKGEAKILQFNAAIACHSHTQSKTPPPSPPPTLLQNHYKA